MAVPHQPVQPIAVATPLGVMVSAVDADLVDRWNIKRSLVSGGPYTLIAISAEDCYVDPTASRGVTYYYVLSATNKDGESLNSAQVSATIPVTPPPPDPPAPTVCGDCKYHKLDGGIGICTRFPPMYQDWVQIPVTHRACQEFKK